MTSSSATYRLNVSGVPGTARFDTFTMAQSRALEICAGHGDIQPRESLEGGVLRSRARGVTVEVRIVFDT